MYHTDPGPGADCIFCGSILFLVFIYFKIIFSFFGGGMVIYDYEFETKENKIQTKEKLSHNTYT